MDPRWQSYVHDILQGLLRSLVADSDPLERSQWIYDTADSRKEETGHTETAFVAGCPYSLAEWRPRSLLWGRSTGHLVVHMGIGP